MSIIVKIMGGLGNQMFQYACGKAIAHRLKAKLYLDLSWYKDKKAHMYRPFLLNCFSNIKIFTYKNKTIKRYHIFKRLQRKINKLFFVPIEIIEEPVHQSCTYWQRVEEIQSSANLSGYWQNEKYFSDIDTIIRKDFKFPNFTCINSKKIAKKITSLTNSVSIHVRRGDYINNSITNQFHGSCSAEYFKEAIQLIASRNNPLELFIFSDDPEWVKENFDTQGYPSLIIDIPQHKDIPYQDMHLMSLCKHHIIANSSFSWWGAWLSKKDGIVVAPNQWFADEEMRQYNPSCESWIKI